MSEDKELTPEELKAELERVREALKAANAESAGRRKELERIAKEQEEADKAKLSETEKLQKELEEFRTKNEAFQAELRRERIHIAIVTEATALGFANPEHAYTLIDKSEIEVKDGTVSGFEKQLKALAESGSLAMKDQKKSDHLGTPPGRGKPPSGLDEQEAPIVRF